MRAAIAFFLLGCFGLASSAIAQPGGPDYDVDVLVFEIRAPDLEGSELWTRIEQPVETSEAVTPDDRRSSETFAAAAEALRSDDRFRVLLQTRWVQQAEPRSSASAVLLRTWDGEIEGTLTFYQSRFMHVELDLLFQSSTFAIGADATPGYSIREERRIRTKEINYFDHPKFGVLVRVTPVKR